MSNHIALGIEKEMEDEFKSYTESDLKKLMGSSFFAHPYITMKKREQSYCTIEVVSCQHKDWWYKNLIGMQFFCRIVFDNYNGKKSIKEYVGVRITSAKEIVFRSFDPKDVILI